MLAESGPVQIHRRRGGPPLRQRHATRAEFIASCENSRLSAVRRRAICHLHYRVRLDAAAGDWPKSRWTPDPGRYSADRWCSSWPSRSMLHVLPTVPAPTSIPRPGMALLENDYTRARVIPPTPTPARQLTAWPARTRIPNHPTGYLALFGGKIKPLPSCGTFSPH